MKKLLSIFALLLAASVSAQTVPPQFSGLMTNTTDLTCAGVATPTCVTWPMPAIPGQGGSYFDPTWGTTTWELNVPPENVGSPANDIPAYSRVQGFSEDNHYLFMAEGGTCYTDLYDATTTPPTPINRILTTDGSFVSAACGDANWANSSSTPKRIYYIPFDDYGGTPAPSTQLRYVDISACGTGAGNCTLTPTVVHTFSATSDRYFSLGTITSFSIASNVVTLNFGNGTGNGLTVGQTVVPYGLSIGTYLNGSSLLVATRSSGQITANFTHADVTSTSDTGIAGVAGLAANQIETGSGAQGGMFDLTDTYFSFTADLVNGYGRGEIDWIRYNKSTDTVTTQEKWYTPCPGGLPAGCEVFFNSGGEVQNPGYNMIRMNQHPNANYITVIWQCSVYPWVQGCGTEAYGPTYNFLGPISSNNIHQDNGFDVNGVPVTVMVQGVSGTSLDYYGLTIANLTTLSTTAVTAKQIEVPCNFAYAGTPPSCTGGAFLGFKSWHVSMTGTWGSVPGYALISTLTTNVGSSGSFPPDAPTPTTLGTAVTSTGSHTVTPGSMSQVGIGVQLLIDAQNANIETVTVTGVTGSTFTATFAKTHLSTAPVSNISVGDTGWGAMENIAVLIDTTAANESAAQFWRLGRTMSIRDTDYGAEPHTFVNRDWTAYVWGSNWNTDGGVDNAYYTKLSGATSYTLTVSTTTGTGTGTINITNNCQTGSFTSGTTIGPCTATPSGGSVFAGWTGTLGCTGTGTCTASLTGNSTMNAVFNLTPTSAPAMMQGIGRLQGTSVIQ